MNINLNSITAGIKAAGAKIANAAVSSVQWANRTVKAIYANYALPFVQKIGSVAKNVFQSASTYAVAHPYIATGVALAGIGAVVGAVLGGLRCHHVRLVRGAEGKADACEKNLKAAEKSLSDANDSLVKAKEAAKTTGDQLTIKRDELKLFEDRKALKAALDKVVADLDKEIADKQTAQIDPSAQMAERAQKAQESQAIVVDHVAADAAKKAVDDADGLFKAAEKDLSDKETAQKKALTEEQALRTNLAAAQKLATSLEKKYHVKPAVVTV